VSLINGRPSLCVCLLAQGANSPLKLLLSTFSLMASADADNVLTTSAFMDSKSYGAPRESSYTAGAHVPDTILSANLTIEMLNADQLPTEGEAKRKALFGDTGLTKDILDGSGHRKSSDQLFSLRFAFSGFLLSLVDSSPSEICTIAVSNINAMAKWNMLRTSDASVLMSVGWLQIDNHVPSAPFPIALCPIDNEKPREENDPSIWPTSGSRSTTSPLLVIGIEIAPRHSSGIVVSSRVFLRHETKAF
jgi:hypothetical protein